MTALVCCVTPSESWGRRAPLLPCSTLCRGSVLKSSRHKMAPVLLISVCFVIFCGYKGMKCITLTHHCTHTLCAAVVRVPSVGLAPVKETQPVTPVSVTAQVGTSKLHPGDLCHRLLTGHRIAICCQFHFEMVRVSLQDDGTVVMENGILRTVVNRDGTLASLCLVNVSRY